MSNFHSQFKEQVIQHCENTPVQGQFISDSGNVRVRLYRSSPPVEGEFIEVNDGTFVTIQLNKWEMEFTFGEDIVLRVSATLKSSKNRQYKCFRTDDLYPHRSLSELEWFADSSDSDCRHNPYTTNELISMLITDLVNASEEPDAERERSRKACIVKYENRQDQTLSGFPLVGESTK